MAPFRNPFQRKPPPLHDFGNGNDGNIGTNGSFASSNDRPSYSGSRASSALSIKQVKEPDEFKLSGRLRRRWLAALGCHNGILEVDVNLVVNDSGVYLPPSPTEKRGFWSRTPTSTTTSSHRSMLSENEPFSISRESFDSYRRSFDISARSPVIHPDTFPGRQSLDSRNPRAMKTSQSNFSRDKEPEALNEEIFEDVGLDEPKPKKKGFFSKLTESTETNDENSRPSSGHRGFYLPGRKRGQSGQGAELGSMTKSETPKADEVVTSRVRPDGTRSRIWIL